MTNTFLQTAVLQSHIPPLRSRVTRSARALSPVHSCLQREELKPEPNPPSGIGSHSQQPQSPPRKTASLEKCLRTSRSDWRSGKPFPPAPDSWVFTALFKAARHCHCTSGSGWAARGRQRRRDPERHRCARSDTACARAAPPGTAAPARRDTESLREARAPRPKCHAPSWSRSISIHPRSRITASWTLIQVTERNLVPPRRF